MTKQEILKLQKDSLYEFRIKVRTHLSHISYAKKIIADLKRDIAHLEKQIKKENKAL